jgi:hypothetical protein
VKACRDLAKLLKVLRNRMDELIMPDVGIVITILRSRNGHFFNEENNECLPMTPKTLSGHIKMA